MFTFQGQLLGTPEYMSPKQVDLATQDIDTRSDIYSLGVVLYELLAGVLPFERESLEKIGFSELQRTLREQEPASPSVRLLVAVGTPIARCPYRDRKSGKFRIKMNGLIGDFALVGFRKILYQLSVMPTCSIAISSFIFSKAVGYRDVLKRTILE